jgi:hypothetical protein
VRGGRNLRHGDDIAKGAVRMTSRERFARNYMIAASLGVGAFLAVAAAEGLLVLGIVVFVVIVLSFAAVAYWMWTGQRRGEVAADAKSGQVGPTHSKPDRRLLAGGLRNVALAIATIALVLAEKSGLAIVSGLAAAAIASTLAGRSYRARRS